MLDEDKPVRYREKIFAYSYNDVFYMLRTYYGNNWEVRMINPKGGTNKMPYLAIIEKVRK
jgi:hypothetical protein